MEFSQACNNRSTKIKRILFYERFNTLNPNKPGHNHEHGYTSANLINLVHALRIKHLARNNAVKGHTHTHTNNFARPEVPPRPAAGVAQVCITYIGGRAQLKVGVRARPTAPGCFGPKGQMYRCVFVNSCSRAGQRVD